MILVAFTVFHVLLSLAGICAGLIVLYGLLTSKPPAPWTLLFLSTTMATSLTGFLFPVHQFLPSHAVGILTVIAVVTASLAHYRYNLERSWRRTFVITAVVALYFNVFVLIVQLFLRIPFLRALAPNQTEPPFVVTQVGTLVLFTVLGIRAASRFRHERARAAY